MKLIKQKKSRFYKEKLKENIGKPKVLSKALKFLGLLSKKGKISISKKWQNMLGRENKCKYF